MTAAGGASDLPEPPRLHRSYYALGIPGTTDLLLYREGGRGVILKPRANSRLIGRLVWLLDGSHNVESLVSELVEFDPGQVLASLRCLQEAGVLVDAARAELQPDRAAES